jgi:hypothetical protein
MIGFSNLFPTRQTTSNHDRPCPSLDLQAPQRRKVQHQDLHPQGRQEEVSHSTEYFAREEDWDKDSHRLKRSAPLASKINADLARLEEEARGQLIGVNNSLLQLIDGFIIDCKAGRGGLKPGTWRQFISHLNHLRGYCEEQGKTDLTFADIDMTVLAYAWLQRS